LLVNALTNEVKRRHEIKQYFYEQINQD